MRLGAVLLACGLAGVGAGLLLLRPTRAGTVVVSRGQASTGPLELPPRGAELFQGAGAWVDVWDYAPGYQDSAAAAAVGPADVATMAASGARTLYLQTAGVDRTVGPTEEPALLGRFLAAHTRGVRVVGWYAPSPAEPPEEDLALIPRVFWTLPGGPSASSDGTDPAAVHPLGGMGGAATKAQVLAFLGAAGFGDRESTQ